MFAVVTKITDKTRKVLLAKDKAQFANLRHAAASIRKQVMASITKDTEPSQPGTPPHTRGRGSHNLRSAMLFDVNETDAIVGPRFKFVGTSGRAHEFGEKYKGVDFEERPFMLPALLDNLPRFVDQWEGSIGER